MKNLRLVFISSSALVASTALVLAACSSDDTVATLPPDSGADSTTPDGSRPDTGTDDDAGTDSGDTDAGLKLDTFEEVVADALCSSLARCCFGNANVPEGGTVDGGTYNRARCLDLYGDLGFESSLLGSAALTLGNVTLDQTKGADCLAKLKVLSCSLTGTELKAARAACYGALAGKLAANQPCRASVECAPGHFCLPDADAGTPDAGAAGTAVIGKCAPLRGASGNCSTVDTTGSCADGGAQCVYDQSILDSEPAEEACSYRGGGDTNLRCSSYDPVGDVYKSRDQWTCELPVANDAGCNSTVWCSDGVCDPTQGFLCKSPVDYFTPAACNSFVTP